MPAVGDLYKVMLHTTCRGQNFLNVFHYQCLTAPGSAGELAQRFGLSVWDEVKMLLSSDNIYDHITVQNQNDATDFINWVGAFGNGVRGGVSDSTHQALSFTYVSARSDAYSGGKRFGSPAIADINDGQLVASLNPQIGVVESACEGPISGATGQVYRPRIWGQRTTDPLGLKFINPIAGVNYLGVTTQNTRKFYTSPGW